MTLDLAQQLRRFAGGERSKAEDAETPFRKGLHEARATTFDAAAARIGDLEAEVAQLTAELVTVKAERDEARKQLSRLDARMDEALALIPASPSDGPRPCDEMSGDELAAFLDKADARATELLAADAPSDGGEG